MATVPAFPFPARTATDIAEIIYDRTKNTGVWIDLYYNRVLTAKAGQIRAQYLSMERELMETFVYVLPNVPNLQSSSAKFATIIRECANLFETVSRDIYSQVYLIGSNDVNVNNFLSLEYLLNLANEDVYCPSLAHIPVSHNLTKPFAEMIQWDRSSIPGHLLSPEWWKAYNKIKHDVGGLEQYATMKNAVRAVGACYIWLTKIYGPGLVGGVLPRTATTPDNKLLSASSEYPGSQLFPQPWSGHAVVIPV